MIFADTSYFIALLNPQDQWNDAARRAATNLRERSHAPRASVFQKEACHPEAYKNAGVIIGSGMTLKLFR
jgi:predicted nucleic acid-binding protein